MQNILTEHERVALALLEEYADNSKETNAGTVKWIEPNDTSWRISYGMVVKITLDWWTDGTGWHCRVDVKTDSGFIEEGELMRDLSDADQQKIVDIICDYSADTEVYRPKDIREVMQMMADYALNCEDEQELQYYFEQIVNTGLFRDAVGAPILTEDNGKVLVSTSY